MAIRKIADLTTAARNGLTNFLENEEGVLAEKLPCQLGYWLGVL